MDLNNIFGHKEKSQHKKKVPQLVEFHPDVKTVSNQIFKKTSDH